MKVEELRIGNYLLNFLREPFKANIETLRLFVDGSPEFRYPEPILLTDDILLNCGIKGTHTKVLHGIFKIAPKHDGGYNIHIGTEFHTITVNECKIKPIFYLHELQNLYYSLSGKELEITL